MSLKSSRYIYIYIYIRGKGDISNFADYPASTECSMKLKPAADPFLDW